MRLAVFDLDHTLLAADSDQSWGQYLCDQGLVDSADYAAKNQAFYQDYTNGCLDVDAFYRFSLAPLMQRPVADWLELRADFVSRIIAPKIAPLAPPLLERHRAAGDTILITTATQRFITQPIADLLAVEHLLATEPEVIDDRFTGRVLTVNFQSGKVTHLAAWLAAQSQRYTHITAYSDSRNDIPLLEFADVAVAVDADPVLRAHAQSKGWANISLRG